MSPRKKVKAKNNTVFIYDSTLRDGGQAEGISLSVTDKLRITERLDQFGIHYVEGGWPGSNPKDVEYFNEVHKLKLKNTKVAAFGSTRRARIKAKDDLNLQALIAAKTPVVTIFGKSWDLHVEKALRVSLEENLRMIEDSVKFLRSKKKETIYDAEHFFDGYRSDPEYAIKTLQAAESAGAQTIVLCDTNGGNMPDFIADVVDIVRENVSVPIGIHAHNDTGVAVANSLIAVVHGANHVQGTINGYGERCGNADLIAIIPNLELKYGKKCLGKEKLKQLTSVSLYVSEIANQVQNDRQPYVGRTNFAHKGGIHVSAVQRLTKTYEHIEPEIVGNVRRVLASDQSGRSNIFWKAEQFEMKLDKDTPDVKNILNEIKKKEKLGYVYEGADASLEILMKKTTGAHRKFFDLEGFRVIVEKDNKGNLNSEATIKVIVDGIEEHTASEGDGPLDALDGALRKALEEFYPSLKDVKLEDFKVRVLDATEGTAAAVRVLIQSRDSESEWNTTGVSENIIEASYQALCDSIDYKLLRQEEKGVFDKKKKKKAAKKAKTRK